MELLSKYQCIIWGIFWYLTFQLPIRQGFNRNLIHFTLEIKDVFNLFVFEVEIVLKIKDNLCLFALSWLDIKYKTKHCKGDRWSIVIHKVLGQDWKVSRLFATTGL